MAKYDCELRGNFIEILSAIDKAVMGGSVSASLEDSSDYSFGDTRCAVRVYERYSYIGQNRVSMSVTLVGNPYGAHLTAITSGGSQAIFFKINTFGEEAFLKTISEVVENYR